MSTKETKHSGSKELTSKGNGDPFFALQRAVNRVFDDFNHGFFDIRPSEMMEMGYWREFIPQVDVTEDAKEVLVTAEVPGMEEKDLHVALSKKELTIKGEKRDEKEEKDKNHYRMERSFGSFQRTILLPSNVDSAKAKATFKNGVLKVSVPKSEQARQEVKKVPIQKD